MLELLQVLQRPTSLKPTSVSVLAKEKMETLLTDSNVDFDCAETPFVNADPDLLGRVLEELLRNAVAYTKESSSPRVEVGYVSEDQVYFVRDNGVGFDMAKANQLFKPFTRLHQTEPSEGLGMGLAIASRCVERMGGRLWASSSPGKGSTFFFSLGKDSDF